MQIPDLLINPHYQDRYFDVVNALAEARQIYCENCQLMQPLQARSELRVGETGFGAGRVLLALLLYLCEQAAAQPPSQPWLVEFASVELHPLPFAQQAEILKLFATPEPSLLNSCIDQVIGLYQGIDLQKFHSWQSQRLKLPWGQLKLRIWLGEALEMLEALHNEQPSEAALRDAWFLEGHGPKSNPEIWRREVITQVGQLTREGGRCASFTVSGELRRELRAAGFQTDRLPGLGGKKQVLLGTRRSATQANTETIQVLEADPLWPQHFMHLREQLCQALHVSSELQWVGLEHIGSTSVPGLASRPVLDLALLVSSPLKLAALQTQLQALGYQREAHQPHPLSRCLRSPVQALPHSLWLSAVDNPFLHQQLLLRDFLRQAPAQAAEYAQLKQALATRYPHDLRAYAGAKTRLINRLLAEARKQFEVC